MAPAADYSQSLIKAYTVDHDVLEGAALVAGSLEDHADNPAASNATKFVGFASYATSSGGAVPLVMHGGIVMAIAASAVSLLDNVRIADTAGRLETASQDDNVVGVALRAAATLGDRFPVLVTRSPGGSGLMKGVVPAARLKMSVNPSDADTISIGGSSFTFKTSLAAATTTTQVKIGANLAATNATLLNAINGVTDTNVVANTTPFAASVVADSPDSTHVRIRLASSRGGNAVAGVATSTALASTLTTSGDIWNCANLNVSGKAETDNKLAVGSVAITAAMITYGSFDVELPFTPSAFTWNGTASTGVPRAINEAITISTNALHLVFAGGASPNWQAGDIFRFTAVS